MPVSLKAHFVPGTAGQERGALLGPAAAGRDLSRLPGPQGGPREETAPASWALPERPGLPAVLALPWQQLKVAPAQGEASTR